MSSEKLKKIFARLLPTLLTAHLLAYSLPAAEPPDLEEQTRIIAAELRCPVCQNLSVADSPSELAQQMRALVREQLEQGKSPDEVKKFFVSKYGDWVLLAPPARGVGLLLWILPGAAALAGVALVAVVLRRRVGKKAAAPAEAPGDSDSRREFFLAERERLAAETREIEFDFQAGKLSEADYLQLRRDLEAQAAAAAKELDALPQRSAPRPIEKKAKEVPAIQPPARKNWQLAAGGLFLLLFGLALGVLVTQSLRPRASERDTITGDFLTGTGGAGADPELARGRAAFERGDLGQAIDAFKKVLAAEPNHPEAHAYMGFMLAQAGHNDGAVMAFDRALAVDPNFPLALLGKGMLLYQTGGDSAEARRLLEKVSVMMPAGAEKTEVEQAIAKITQSAQGGGGKNSAASPAQKTNSAGAGIQGTQSVQGVIDLDPKLKGKVPAGAVLFIIAKGTGGAGGPPLAVKKIAAPKFPLDYALGAGDVMMPGASFSGKLYVTARLDQDGNPLTKQPGDLAGEYKKNPADAGAKKIDILLAPAD
ncbi:MAG TPA: cytochrome c-type biogenesis protein CcmH [Candidatus Binatia bacterium]